MQLILPKIFSNDMYIKRLLNFSINIVLAILIASKDRKQIKFLLDLTELIIVDII